MSSHADAARALIEYALGYRCPDCPSTSIVTVSDAVIVLDVEHDDSCPALKGVTTP